MTSKDFSVFDCDGHVIEPGSLWSDYVEPEYRDDVRGGFWKEDYLDGGWQTYLNGEPRGKRVGNAVFFGAVGGPGTDKEKLSQLRMGVDEFPIPPGAFDPHARLSDMDLMGIDQAMLVPTFCGMWFTAIEQPRAAVGLARAYNNWIADFCRAAPDRLFASAVIPQHRDEDAIAEIRRTADLGFTCAIIRPNIVGGRHPAHPSFDPVWQAIQDTGMVAGVHPFPGTAPPDCTGWFIDQVAAASALPRGIVSETLCFAHDAQVFLMMAFHNDLYARFPSLKLAIFESNASWLPYLLNKADGHVKIWDATRGRKVSVPSETFLARSWIGFESDEESVFKDWEFFHDIAVWASDFPHFDAEDAWEAIEHMEEWGVPADAQAKMLGANAARMFGLQPHLAVKERLPLPAPA